MLPTYDAPIEAYLNNMKRRSSRTFAIDWENKRLLSQTIDGTEALGQDIEVRLQTEWERFDIMPDTFGLELKALIDSEGEVMESAYVLANMQLLIGEALSPDLRIKEIRDFSAEMIDKHRVHVSMTVVCEDGVFDKEVTINVG